MSRRAPRAEEEPPRRVLFVVDDFLRVDGSRSFASHHAYPGSVLFRILQKLVAEGARVDRDGDPVYHHPLQFARQGAVSRWCKVLYRDFEPSGIWLDVRAAWPVLHLLLACAFRGDCGPAVTLGFRPGRKRYVELSGLRPASRRARSIETPEALRALKKYLDRTLRHAPNERRKGASDSPCRVLRLWVGVFVEGFRLQVETRSTKDADDVTNSFCALEAVAGERFDEFLDRVEAVMPRLLTDAACAPLVPWHLYKVAPEGADPYAAAGVYVLARDERSALRYVGERGLLPPLAGALGAFRRWKPNVAEFERDDDTRTCAVVLHPSDAVRKNWRALVVRALRVLAGDVRRDTVDPFGPEDEFSIEPSDL